MNQITLDYQTLQGVCPSCKQTFTICRGSVFEEGEGIAIYLAALHACQTSKLVDLAISIRKGYQALPETSALILKVRPAETDFQMTIVDIHESFWQTETYLGKRMDRQAALASPWIEAFFHVADHIVMEIPEVQSYLAE